MHRRISLAAGLVLAFSLSSAHAADLATVIREGTAFANVGDSKASERVFAEALKSLPPNIQPIEVTPLWNGLALALDTQGRYAESERFFRKVTAAIESARGTENPEYAAALANLGGSLLGEGQIVSAENAIREAIRIHVATGPPGSTVLAMARAGLVQLLIAKEDWRAAEPIARQAIADLSGFDDIRSGRHAMAMNNLAVIRSQQGSQKEAAALLRLAIVEIEANLAPGHPVLVQVLSNLASAYTAMGQKNSVEDLYVRALAISEAHAGTANPDYASILMNYSEFLRRAGRKKESRTIRARSLEATTQNARRNGIGTRLDVSSFRNQGR